MKTAVIAAISLLSPFATASAVASNTPRDEKVSFDGHQVIRITDAPRGIENELSDFFATRSGRSVDVVVPPNEVSAFMKRGLNTELLDADIGEKFRREAEPGPYDRALHKRGDLPDLNWYDSYHPYEDHLQYWEDLQAAFPNNSRISELPGKSYEGRSLHVFEMWGDKGKVGDKPAVLWHGTVHAREWITTMTVEYLTWQLINGYKNGDLNATTALDEFDFYIVPFHNPDGFVYTQTTNRLWRKNRQPRSNTTCIGTDNNRNWDYEWDFPIEDGQVASNPCSETFKGLTGGDTPENQALVTLSQELASRPKGIRLYIDWHSYSQLILLPWGFSCDPALLPANLPRQREVGAGYANAIDGVSGKFYEVGPSCEILYYSSGTGRDYHHGAHNATFSWSVELRPGRGSSNGFVLPPQEIRPTSEEHWAGIQWVLNDIRKDGKGSCARRA
ncbi:hypothetical protein PspLS_06914 [Pyricularia sp. CBS 133598]|nr:hypothetical protein PspLS_06914 [Pyricularia sp. CBS 133598]